MISFDPADVVTTSAADDDFTAHGAVMWDDAPPRRWRRRLFRRHRPFAAWLPADAMPPSGTVVVRSRSDGTCAVEIPENPE